MYPYTRVDRDTQRPTGFPEPGSGEAGPTLTGTLRSRSAGPKHPDPGLAIEASDLTKVFGTTPAVQGIDLAVPAGSVHAVLGPNAGVPPLSSERWSATSVATSWRRPWSSSWAWRWATNSKVAWPGSLRRWG